ncbi:hypothetical protein Pst134EA_029288 [Puccinia striiformis f. sp. tritici]|uniref:hypothetical protein n=1 Tax=Puccinia striiformis f. sp. tritici TaxID=168172 RepID=UPI0020084034|nr:hypothetical protein Pst134EA_029288 [Puccinia striiformis f. sp. tritici]KAH9447254.1 hypothetical protein Pst134EA_029288 [Puccinia striiformis f. sp. tritici]
MGSTSPGTRVSQCGLGYQPDSANYITTCTDYNKVQWQCYTEQCHAGEAKTDPKVEPYWRFEFTKCRASPGDTSAPIHPFSFTTTGEDGELEVTVASPGPNDLKHFKCEAEKARPFCNDCWTK